MPAMPDPQARRASRPITGMLAALIAAALLSPAFGQFGGPAEQAEADTGRYADARKLAAEADEQNRKQHAGDDRYLVRPGLLADREAREVTLWGAATELSDNDPVEFFAIHADSGKTYEALAVSFARPSDLHEALTFLGMSPGEPIDYPDLRFWPKGERVSMTFHWDDEKRKTKSASAFKLVRNMKTGAPMTQTGLMFVGSVIRQRENGEKVYAADVANGMSIASTYNEPTTVLDVPRQAPQGTVYGQYKPNPKMRLAVGTPLKITIAPRRPADKPRVRDLRLVIKPAPGPAEPDQPVHYALLDTQAIEKDQPAEPLNEKPTLVSLFAALETIRKNEQDPFVTVAASPDLELEQVQQAAELIARIDKPEGVRVEPPRPGHLYYKAFTPDPDRRKREDRVFHGWELLLERDNGRLDMQLIATEDQRDETGQWSVVENRYPVDSPKEVANVMNKVDTRGPRDVYVYAPADLTYGSLLRALQPALKTHNTVLVYLEKPEQ